MIVMLTAVLRKVILCITRSFFGLNIAEIFDRFGAKIHAELYRFDNQNIQSASVERFVGIKHLDPQKWLRYAR